MLQKIALYSPFETLFYCLERNWQHLDLAIDLELRFKISIRAVYSNVSAETNDIIYHLK